MSTSEAKKSATGFLKEQAAIMAKYGPAPKLSGSAYQQALRGAQKTFHSLSVYAKQK